MAEPLKNQLLQKPFFVQLGQEIEKVYPSFQCSEFIQRLYDEQWPNRSLTERMSHASQVLNEQLATNYESAIAILRSVCHHFGGFDGMLLSDYVRQFGLDHPELSLEALELFTQHGSSEFAIRPLIKKYPELGMKKMRDWSTHPNYHVRRLSSEGSRPRLPWSMALPEFINDPSPVLPILENLKDDPEIYVRKSVANHINDISKDNPQVVLDLVSPWMKKTSENTHWIVKQGLRTLVKQGNQKALTILGYHSTELVLDSFARIPSKVKFGNAIDICFSIKNKSKKPAQVMVDYIIYHQKQNGTLVPKVFKLKSLKINPGETVPVRKAHHFIPINTRKYYAGEHRVAIQVNGNILDEQQFQLIL